MGALLSEVIFRFRHAAPTATVEKSAPSLCHKPRRVKIGGLGQAIAAIVSRFDKSAGA
jgi:hypothetical protein